MQEAIETVTIQIANLELTITARVLSEGRASSVEASAVPAARVQVNAQLQDQALAATTPGLCSNLPIPFLDHLAPRLRGTGTSSEWGPQARIGRAFRAGVVARRQLAGEYQAGTSPAIPFRNTIYVVLRDRIGGHSFWTHSYGVYGAAVKDPRGQEDFHQESVSHAFASRAEAEAYVAGAGEPWPQQRQG